MSYHIGRCMLSTFDVAQPMLTRHAWSLKALASADGIRRCCFPLVHMLRRILPNSDRWCHAGVHIPCLMHVRLCRCRMTSPHVNFRISTCYTIACRPWPISSSIGRCAHAKTNVAPWRAHTPLYTCGPSWISPLVGGLHFPYVHVQCVRAMTNVICHWLMGMYDSHI